MSSHRPTRWRVSGTAIVLFFLALFLALAALSVAASLGWLDRGGGG